MKNKRNHDTEDEEGLCESFIQRRNSFDANDHLGRSNINPDDFIDKKQRVGSAYRRAKSGMRSP